MLIGLLSVRRLSEVMTFPKKYDASSAPTEILALVGRLVPGLIGGEHPVHAALREQFRRASVKEVEKTGHGFFVDFDTPSDVPLTVPASFAGGNAEIVLEGAKNVQPVYPGDTA